LDGSDGAYIRQVIFASNKPAWLPEILEDALSRWGMYTSRAADGA
jgi:hypothetical protein